MSLNYSKTTHMRINNNLCQSCDFRVKINDYEIKYRFPPSSGVAAQLAAPGFWRLCRPASYAVQHSITAKIFLWTLLAVQESKCVLCMLMREECRCNMYISTG